MSPVNRRRRTCQICHLFPKHDWFFLGHLLLEMIFVYHLLTSSQLFSYFSRLQSHAVHVTFVWSWHLPEQWKGISIKYIWIIYFLPPRGKHIAVKLFDWDCINLMKIVFIFLYLFSRTSISANNRVSWLICSPHTSRMNKVVFSMNLICPEANWGIIVLLYPWTYPNQFSSNLY